MENSRSRMLHPFSSHSHAAPAVPRHLLFSSHSHAAPAVPRHLAFSSHSHAAPAVPRHLAFSSHSHAAPAVPRHLLACGPLGGDRCPHERQTITPGLPCRLRKKFLTSPPLRMPYPTTSGLSSASHDQQLEKFPGLDSPQAGQSMFSPGSDFSSSSRARMMATARG